MWLICSSELRYKTTRNKKENFKLHNKLYGTFINKLD